MKKLDQNEDAVDSLPKAEGLETMQAGYMAATSYMLFEIGVSKEKLLDIGEHMSFDKYALLKAIDAMGDKRGTEAEDFLLNYTVS